MFVKPHFITSPHQYFLYAPVILTIQSNQAVAKQKVSDDLSKDITDHLPDVEPTVKTFTDVRKMLLSDVGIGLVRPWRSDELGYMNSTPYYEFGTSVENGLRNNLAFYVESTDPNYVRVVKLMLNINNCNANAAAWRKYVQGCYNCRESVRHYCSRAAQISAVEKAQPYDRDIHCHGEQSALRGSSGRS